HLTTPVRISWPQSAYACAGQHITAPVCIFLSVPNRRRGVHFFPCTTACNPASALTTARRGSPAHRGEPAPATSPAAPRRATSPAPGTARAPPRKPVPHLFWEQMWHRPSSHEVA